MSSGAKARSHPRAKLGQDDPIGAREGRPEDRRVCELDVSPSNGFEQGTKFLLSHLGYQEEGWIGHPTEGWKT